MTTDYDPIAEDYQRAKQSPWRHHIEAFTLLGLLPDLTGKAVIDIACGEGSNTLSETGKISLSMQSSISPSPPISSITPGTRMSCRRCATPSRAA